MADPFDAPALRECLRAALATHRRDHPAHPDITLLLVPPSGRRAEARVLEPATTAGEARRSALALAEKFTPLEWLALMGCRLDVPSVVQLGADGVTVEAID